MSVSPSDAHLARLDQATRALAEVCTASEAWELSRTAEAARRYAQLRGLGTEAVNYATAVKAKALILLADFVDAGQDDGSIATVGRPKMVPIGNHFSRPAPSNFSELLGTNRTAGTFPHRVLHWRCCPLAVQEGRCVICFKPGATELGFWLVGGLSHDECLRSFIATKGSCV